MNGWITLSFCIKFLILPALLLTVGGYYGNHYYQLYRSAPNLALTAVYHGDQYKWCYEKDIDVSELKTFVDSELKDYATSVTHLPETTPPSLQVVYQATPHNQCQLIFSKKGDASVTVNRRRFSHGPSIRKQDAHYAVRSDLQTVHLNDPQPVEELGDISTSFDTLLTQFNVTSAVVAPTIPAETQVFLEAVYRQNEIVDGPSPPDSGISYEDFSKGLQASPVRFESATTQNLYESERNQ